MMSATSWRPTLSFSRRVSSALASITLLILPSRTGTAAVPSFSL